MLSMSTTRLAEAAQDEVFSFLFKLFNFKPQKACTRLLFKGSRILGKTGTVCFFFVDDFDPFRHRFV